MSVAQLRLDRVRAHLRKRLEQLRQERDARGASRIATSIRCGQIAELEQVLTMVEG